MAEKTENKNDLLREIKKQMRNFNSEVAEKADVSNSWVSEVLNGHKESEPVQRTIAETVILKGNKLTELGQRLNKSLD